MSDIKTYWDTDNGVGYWTVVPGDLASDDDLETAVLISLFTDRLAHTDDNIDQSNRRGWWGDTDADYQIGSRLYLIRRTKLTTETAKNAKIYATEALQWLIDDGIVSDITVQTQIVFPSRLYLAISYTKPGQITATTQKFGWAWDQVKNAV